MVRGTLTREEADNLFMREAFLVGTDNVIPYQRAVYLLGKDAVEFANEAGTDRNEYWLGSKERSIAFLYKAGFRKAVTYHNVLIALNDEEKDKEI